MYSRQVSIIARASRYRLKPIFLEISCADLCVHRVSCTKYHGQYRSGLIAQYFFIVEITRSFSVSRFKLGFGRWGTAIAIFSRSNWKLQSLFKFANCFHLLSPRDIGPGRTPPLTDTLGEKKNPRQIQLPLDMLWSVYFAPPWLPSSRI